MLQKNHLANETSPYLLQHADNPVNWYPWGEEALSKAKNENKPILLSIGYAACHWCHVMEHESFEDIETATLMNDRFVCIKVDREERSDIDQVYMTFVQMTTGSGGWPLNVFLTPDQVPYFGGTYFPPDERYGRPSWKKVLLTASEFYSAKKNELNKNLSLIRDAYTKGMQNSENKELPGEETLNTAVTKLAQSYDDKYGGLGQPPKFPSIQPFMLFLRHYKKSGEKEFLNMVSFSLEKMSNGGIYDQIGGGFARYSIDEKWLAPHFEKMLYDNAQLTSLYLNTYLITKDNFYLDVVRETLEFVNRELASPEGGFYSSLDADSEGEEGKYYVWKKKEILDLLGEKEGAIFCEYFNVSEQGNFEGKNILNIVSDIKSISKKYKLKADGLLRTITKGKSILLNERNKRVRPMLDDKILTAWNGLMLSAFSRAYQTLKEQQYKQTIEKNISFIKNNLVKDGTLLRTSNKGIAKYDGYLDDYAYLIQGLLDAYEALFDVEYLEWANELLGQVNSKFWDQNNSGYFYTSDDSEKLIMRMKDEYDHSTPSATAIMALNNLRLYSLTENPELVAITEKIFKKYRLNMETNTYAFSSYLNALDFYLQKPKEILIISADKQKFDEFGQTVFNHFRPNKVVLSVVQNSIPQFLDNNLTKGKKAINGKSTAYVCHNFTCSPPVTTVKELSKLLDINAKEY